VSYIYCSCEDGTDLVASAVPPQFRAALVAEPGQPQHVSHPAGEAKNDDSEVILASPSRMDAPQIDPRPLLATLPSETSRPEKPVMVLLHGFGAGKALFLTNMMVFARHYRVYALDWPGVGTSFRPHFRAQNAAETEAFFVDALDNWRVKHNIDRFVLLGHSFGGYLAAVYALKCPERVTTVVLASPVGVPVPPPDTPSGRSHWPSWLRFVFYTLWWLNLAPQTLLRFAGPFGPAVLRKLLTMRFSHVDDVDIALLADYLYHVNAGPPSGERALTRVLKIASVGIAAHSPLAPRLLDLQVPIAFIYGQHDWMDVAAGKEVCRQLQALNKHAVHRVVVDAGHQVFMENPKVFNEIVLDVASGKF